MCVQDHLAFFKLHFNQCIFSAGIYFFKVTPNVTPAWFQIAGVLLEKSSFKRLECEFALSLFLFQVLEHIKCEVVCLEDGKTAVSVEVIKFMFWDCHQVWLEFSFSKINNCHISYSQETPYSLTSSIHYCKSEIAKKIQNCHTFCFLSFTTLKKFVSYQVPFFHVEVVWHHVLGGWPPFKLKEKLTCSEL